VYDEYGCLLYRREEGVADAAIQEQGIREAIGNRGLPRRGLLTMTEEKRAVFNPAQATPIKSNLLGYFRWRDCFFK
jgi:hypothetical protein